VVSDVASARREAFAVTLRAAVAVMAAGLTLLMLTVAMADQATPTGPHQRVATIGAIAATPVGQVPLTPRSRSAQAVAGLATESSAMQPRSGGDAPAPGADSIVAMATLTVPVTGSPTATPVRAPTEWTTALTSGPDRAPPRLLPD
jgi:hypothetical protein